MNWIKTKDRLPKQQDSGPRGYVLVCDAGYKDALEEAER